MNSTAPRLQFWPLVQHWPGCCLGLAAAVLGLAFCVHGMFSPPPGETAGDLCAAALILLCAAVGIGGLIYFMERSRLIERARLIGTPDLLPKPNRIKRQAGDIPPTNVIPASVAPEASGIYGRN